MEVENKNISESERFKQQYDDVLQIAKDKFKVKFAHYIGISEPKASRVLNGKQFDVLVLIEMASFIGYKCNFEIYKP